MKLIHITKRPLLKTLLAMAKPTKCPSCGNAHFHWDRGGPNGENYWKCNKCGYTIKD